jgi:type V secretory pathway adhesin AidA
MLYEIKSDKKEVNGVEVETWKKEITSANILEVEVGTTGFQGGDTGHGGRTYLKIQDLGCTDINVYLVKDQYFDTKGFTLELGGDTELKTFIEALEFAVKILKKQSKE